MKRSLISQPSHLAWCASDAIIIPVRVDEHSINSLELTLRMISAKNSDFNIWADRAGGIPAPKVASIVMTMAGREAQRKGVKDLASQMYVEKAYGIAPKYPGLFDYDDPADAFAITDDFISAGRISAHESPHFFASGGIAPIRGGFVDVSAQFGLEHRRGQGGSAGRASRRSAFFHRRAVWA